MSFFAVLGLSGCSIHPLPDDVMGYSSRDIATQVRCETRSAIRQEIEATLLAFDKNVSYKSMTGAQTAKWLESNSANYADLKWNDFVGSAKDLFLFYKDTSVSYDFSFEGIENNELGVDAGFSGTFANRNDTVGVGVGNERTRKAKRNFRIYDSFESLAVGMKDSFCVHFNKKDILSKLPDKSERKTPDFVFPSTGLIKIRTLIHDFLIQNQTGNLGDDDKWNTAEMTDTITFTTKSKANLSPSTAHNPLSHGFGFASLGLTNNHYRQDEHTIIIIVSLPADKTGQPVYDEDGRLIDPKTKAAKIASASRQLDRAKLDNFQDNFKNLETLVIKQ